MHLSIVTIDQWLQKEVPVRLVHVNVVSQPYKQCFVEPFNLPVLLQVLLGCCIQLDSTDTHSPAKNLESS